MMKLAIVVGILLSVTTHGSQYGGGGGGGGFPPQYPPQQQGQQQQQDSYGNQQQQGQGQGRPMQPSYPQQYGMPPPPPPQGQYSSSPPPPNYGGGALTPYGRGIKRLLTHYLRSSTFMTDACCRQFTTTELLSLNFSQKSSLLLRNETLRCILVKIRLSSSALYE
jgi:hypothetical protein